MSENLSISPDSANIKLYMDIFNSTNFMYEELGQNFIKLQSEQQRRIVPKFDDSENKAIDKKIKELIIDMTSKVKKCENNIKQLSSISLTSTAEENIKNNMKINLASKIKAFTHDFRWNEEKYMRNYKELVGAEEIIEDKYNYSHLSHDSGSGFLDQIGDNHWMKRDEDISTLLTSISELAETFKDLQLIVQEQGTIWDRIDYNIENALDSTKDAHKQLVKANENMKKNCFRNSTMTLWVVIFVLAVLLLLKYTK